MPRATGLRLLSAFFFLTIIGSPIGLLLYWFAIKKEKEREQELENLERIADNVDSD